MDSFNAPVVNDFIERFLLDHVKGLKSEREYRRILKQHAKPTLGTVPIREVTAGHVDKIFSETGRGQGKQVQANRVLAVMNTMFKKSELWKMLDRHGNPCQGIESSPSTRGAGI